MSQKSGNSDYDSLAAQIEAVQFLARRLLAAVTILPETNDNAELLPLAEKLTSMDFAGMLKLANEKKPETDPSPGLAKLQQELELQNQKMYEFKISLADSVIEFRNCQKDLQAARETNLAQANQVSQMQLLSKELSLKLSSAVTKLETRESELEAVKKEVMELRSRSYQLKSTNAEYEDHLQKMNADLEQQKIVNATTSARCEKALSDLQHVNTSNKELKQALELLEIKEKELVETVDVLQKERNHLQGKLNALLTGVNKKVEYHHDLPPSTDSSVLEPVMLPPYLPFCFPERLPAVIKFRREIRKTFPSAFSRRPAPVPGIFTNPKKINPNSEAVRMSLRRPRIKTPGKNVMQLAYPLIQADFPNCFFSDIQQHHKSSSTIEGRQDSLAAIIASEPPIWCWNTGRSGFARLEINRKQTFAISTYSLDLYLHFLETTIMKQNFQPSENPLTLVLQPIQTPEVNARMNFSNTLNEMLAFRHRLQLKSQKIDAPRVLLQHSFNRGNKLKSVLEIFGNTISLMVQKYEIFPTSQTGNGENVK